MKKFTEIIKRAYLLLPLLIGWIAGYCVKVIRLTWAAIVEGYTLGSSL